ncbi:biotin-dependent carboxyltransferase family protein [Arthrobacter sp. UM1]|uniref:5-oxoprolinase subunit C family protein n=1 Tax=Arthrobacter sp. UM1 TaxID=2766776 RepID=UPI001CF7115E|nr:biotin-dependent carboxyltransferase family protein [Arthrobacter sp. UM1]MCB4207863.1 biotin-dependent carboxyltransferase [Arthrobacter sp. UM1]
MSLEVLVPGLSTTVQDRGRTGYYHVGLPQGGSLDQYSARLANALVGNGEGEAVLECTYMGPKLRADRPALVAVAGAPVPVKVNGEERGEWESLLLNEGDELEFGVIQGGTRYYIAVAGGVDVPEVLGSRSTYALGALGGLNGRKLEAGDSVPVGAPAGDLQVLAGRRVPEEFRPEFCGSQELRFLFGLYDHRLTEEGRRRIAEETWTLTPVADRMGMRYDGPGVEWVEREQPFGAGSDQSNIVDAGYAVGSIQIPGGTQPIILHRDAVSAGGYAMVGTVISADMDVVARATPGTQTRFVEVTMEEALTARAEARERLDAAVAAIG